MCGGIFLFGFRNLQSNVRTYRGVSKVIWLKNNCQWSINSDMESLGQGKDSEMLSSHLRWRKNGIPTFSEKTRQTGEEFQLCSILQSCRGTDSYEKHIAIKGSFHSQTKNILNCEVTWIWVFTSQLLQSSQLPPPVFFSSFPWVFLRFFCRKKSRGLDFFRTAYTAEPNGQRCMDTWACPACTFENAGSAECCEICQKGRRPEKNPPGNVAQKSPKQAGHFRVADMGVSKHIFSPKNQPF